MNYEPWKDFTVCAAKYVTVDEPPREREKRRESQEQWHCRLFEQTWMHIGGLSSQPFSRDNFRQCDLWHLCISKHHPLSCGLAQCYVSGFCSQRWKGFLLSKLWTSITHCYMHVNTVSWTVIIVCYEANGFSIKQANSDYLYLIVTGCLYWDTLVQKQPTGAQSYTLKHPDNKVDFGRENAN